MGAAIVALTALGFVLRVVNLGQGLFGDELSTAWIVSGHSLGHVLHAIRGNDEITPPLYFVLAWASSKLGSNPDLLRLPSLVAGTASIPLIYALGVRTVGRGAGVLAAAIMAISPFLTYYGTEARSYALMIALVICAALALLNAIDTGSRGWWAAYALASAAAMYTHYTSGFALAAAAIWGLWACPQHRRQIIAANAVAFLLFVPWLPGFVADNNSPTTAILSALQPFTFTNVRLSLENWSVGFPYVGLHVVPGYLAAALIAAGAIAAAGFTLVARRRRGAPTWSRPPDRVVLVVMLALATPLGEAVISAFGTDLLGARNLNSAWPGLALSLGALLAATPMPAAVACTGLVLAGYAIGAARSTEPRAARSDYPAAAQFIADRAKPGDVVVDGAPFTPVPLTGLDAYLPRGHPEFRLGLPTVPRPFLPGDPIPDVRRQISRIFAMGRGHTIFLLVAGKAPTEASVLHPAFAGLSDELLNRLPSGIRVVERRDFPSLAPLAVLVIRAPT